MFQGANEYLTFQQILTFPRDYDWPDGFPSTAKDIILKFLDPEPENRLGVKSFKNVKNHDYFHSAVESGDVIWGQMMQVQPPPQVHQRKLEEPKFDGADPEWMLQDMMEELKLDKEVAEHVELESATSSKLTGQHALNRMSSEDTFSVPKYLFTPDMREKLEAHDWSVFCGESEQVVMSGLVGKKNRAWVTRKRILILISGGSQGSPHFIYISPDSLEVKGIIEYNEAMSVEVKAGNKWSLNVPGRTYLWSCLDSTMAASWVSAISHELDATRGTL